MVKRHCNCQSNFRDSTPDLPVITSPKTRDKPYGSLLSRGCSDVSDCVKFPAGVVLPYGSLSRPRDNCFASCSWRICSDMVCDSLFLFAMDIDSGMIFVDSGMILAGDVIVAFWHLERRYVLREGELWLEHSRQNHTCSVDYQCLDLAAVCVKSVIDLPVLCHVAARVLHSNSHVATHMRRIGHFPVVIQFAMFLYMSMLQPFASQGEL
ncbi:unnamed protein product [Arabis nemorensis]|uniref:Uncharacterized protein n=1 Tax=Arabis nemorensis TaxID=586526 RepID=A0A565AYI0_9BRAS|nr:unnamed protein product [Arabis nemorensis]